MPADETTVDAELARVARRIRAWRDEAGLTLAQLAERSGVAPSTIHKVETHQMVPSVAVLLKIARGLDRSPSELVSEGAPHARVAYLPDGQRRTLGNLRAIAVERLSGDLADPEVEVWRVGLDPGRGSGDAPLEYPGEELVACEDGEVTVEVDGESYRLEPGDVIHFKASLPHSWHNEGAARARLLVVGTVRAASAAGKGVRHVVVMNGGGS